MRIHSRVDRGNSPQHRRHMARMQVRPEVLVLVLLPVLLLLQGPSGPELQAQVAAPKSTITGRASDVNHDPLVSAKVDVQPLGQTVLTDAQGEFRIADLPPGQYTLTISYLGFAPCTKQVTLAAGKIEDLIAELQIDTLTQQVIVRGERERGTVEAINREQAADTILQVLPAEVITSLPNTNIADAVGRLPSVSLERDEGEGKYVQIRGTEPRLSNVTVDGVHLPAPEQYRYVKLDAVPADLVDSVEISKTLAANQEADAIGGSVNLVTKKATDQPYVTVMGMGGYTPIDGGRKLDQFASTLGERFGREKRFGVMFSGSYDWNARGYDDLEPVPGVTSVANGDFAGGVPVVYGEDLRQYWFDRRRFGFATDTDYKLGSNSFMYSRGIFSQFNDNGDYWVYQPNVGNFVSPTQTTPNSYMVFKGAGRTPWQQIFNVAIGAQHTLGRNTIGYEFAGGQARFMGGFPKGVFNGPGNNGLPGDTPLTFTLDNSNPLTPKFIPQAGVDIYDPSKYVLSQVQQLNTHDQERDYTGDMWLSHSYQIDGHFGTLEIGAKVRDANKVQVDDERYYNFTGAQPVLMSQFLIPFLNPSYYNGQYKYGPVALWSKINSYFLANPGLFTEDLNEYHSVSDPNNFSTAERVYAGYAMNTITLGRWRLQGGLRFEGTDESFVGKQATFNPDGSFAFDQLVPGQHSYVDALPSVQATYTFGSSMNIRAGYGRGIARPDFASLPPYASISLAAVGQINTVAEGNPNLVATHAHNFDLLFEKYLKTVGIIQAGWFYKALTDPIYTVQTKPTTGQFASDWVTQPVNGPSAYLTGIELAWQQRLNSLPGLLNGLGLSANYSYVASRANFPALLPGATGRTDHPRLLRNAPNNWNCDITYDKGPISGRMGTTHNDAYIWAYNYSDGAPGGINGPNGDIYLYPHTQVDAELMYRLPHMRDFQVIASFLNMTNEGWGFYMGSEKYPIQREFYNTTYSFGLRWTPNFGEKK